MAGTILWRQGGSPSDGIYLVEDGTLRSIQEFQDNGMVRRSVEVILPGTISGEMGLFTGNDRSSTVVSETDGILWGLSQDKFQKMVKDDPALAVEFMRVAMSYSAGKLFSHFIGSMPCWQTLIRLYLFLRLLPIRTTQHHGCLCF